MIKTAALSLLSAVGFTATVQVHSPVDHPSRLQPAITLHVHPVVTDDRANAIETIAVYYSPLESTKVTRLVGFGMAYHMAIVYTDRAGNSYGASSGPSDNASPQTPANALKAIVFMADQQPSSFGTLVADPSNDHVFIEGHAEDYYTKDREGRAYPHSLVTRGKDLSASWASDLRRRRSARPDLFADEPELEQPRRNGAAQGRSRPGLLERHRLCPRSVHAAAYRLISLCRTRRLVGRQGRPSCSPATDSYG